MYALPIRKLDTVSFVFLVTSNVWNLSNYTISNIFRSVHKEGNTWRKGDWKCTSCTIFTWRQIQPTACYFEEEVRNLFAWWVSFQSNTHKLIIFFAQTHYFRFRKYTCRHFCSNSLNEKHIEFVFFMLT